MCSYILLLNNCYLGIERDQTNKYDKHNFMQYFIFISCKNIQLEIKGISINKDDVLFTLINNNSKIYDTMYIYIV